jgi:uncharacterized protein YjbI with pentapeptide repeats
MDGNDLGAEELAGRDHRGADLRRAKLRGANLQWKDFTDANLEGVDLEAQLARLKLRWQRSSRGTQTEALS